MFPLIHVHYYGEQTIEYWEFAVGFLYVLCILLYFGRRKRAMEKRGNPEYRFFLTGLSAKLFAVIVFSLLYYYYYDGGDSTSYFFGAQSMRNMALHDPGEYLVQMLGDNSSRAWHSYTPETKWPYQFMFYDPRVFAVIRVTSLLILFTFNSYLITNLLLASLSYLGVWACYRTFVSYFPEASWRLAIAFLFMPSVVFWGSPILKDTFTFGAACWWVHAVDEVFFKRRNVVSKSVAMFVSAGIIILIKPYIFMVLMPATVAWVGYSRVARLRNALVKFVLIPVFIVAAVGISMTVLQAMGGSFDKFALDKALTTIEVTQDDLSNEAAYGSNSFDLGAFDGTWTGVVSKFPIAVNATLFRPYLWESGNVVMMLSGLENLWVLGFTLWVMLKAGPGFLLRSIGSVPLLLMCMVFALLFSFAIGVTTPNFGALVRFKIPMMPFYISGLYLVLYLSELRKQHLLKGRPFNLRDYRSGTAAVAGPSR